MTKVRSTKNPIQALERLAAAAGWEFKKGPGGFLIKTPGCKDAPIPKKSTRALAFLVAGLRGRDDWEELRQATAYDPGVNHRTGDIDVPVSGICAWEEAALKRLAVTEVS